MYYVYYMFPNKAEVFQNNKKFHSNSVYVKNVTQLSKPHATKQTKYLSTGKNMTVFKCQVLRYL